jgi:hypothetical protein
MLVPESWGMKYFAFSNAQTKYVQDAAPHSSTVEMISHFISEVLGVIGIHNFQ